MAKSDKHPEPEAAPEPEVAPEPAPAPPPATSGAPTDLEPSEGLVSVVDNGVGAWVGTYADGSVRTWTKTPQDGES